MVPLLAITDTIGKLLATVIPLSTAMLPMGAAAAFPLDGIARQRQRGVALI